MLSYVIRRLAALIPILIGVTLLAFIVSHALPGDPARQYAGINASEAQVEAIRARLGLDRSLPQQYRVYMIGFAPGFPYLGGLPQQLATPRLATPRVRIPSGSVGIAESQTGVYPAASPGGWRLIGRTPVRLFDPERDPPSLVVAGDYIRFAALRSAEEYSRIAEEVEAGVYRPDVASAKTTTSVPAGA